MLEQNKTEWKVRIIDVINQAPGYVFEPVWKKIVRERMPEEVEEEVKRSAIGCVEMFNTTRGIASCIASEIVELMVRKGFITKEEAKERIKEVGGPEEFVSITEKTIKERQRDIELGYLLDIMEGR